MKGPALLAMVMLSACGKAGSESASTSSNAGGGASASSNASTGVNASASSNAGAAASGGPGANPSASPSAGRAPDGVVGWRGGYKSVAADITLPKDVKWRVPESTEGVGDGTIALTVDPATGRVHGTVDGVLGPARVEGIAADGRLTATLLRQDPRDHGFIGTLTGDISDAGVHGTLNAALAEASAVRSASFDLAPARPTATGL